MNTKFQPNIEARKDIDFGLDADFPKYWNGNDPFKTRVMDALQLSFPDGERYFISSVRAFRDRITDPKLQRDVKEFTMQEAQHGIAHTKFNDLLAAQGMPMETILNELKEYIKRDQSKYSDEFNLALTAAYEHFTALLAETFFSRKEVTVDIHPKMRALLAWHAIEEMEHRSVAFNVMKTVAKVGYIKRCAAMVIATRHTTKVMFDYADVLLKTDGYNWFQRRMMFIKNLNWMYGRKGVLSSMLPKLLMYFKPSFHPEDIPVIHNYGEWVRVYDSTGNPHEACDALLAAAY